LGKFKLPGHALPGINQRTDKSSKSDGRAKSSVFQKSEEEMTAAEKQAASLAAAEKADAINVSGGKKTKQGSFIQYPGSTEDGGGSTVAGSSVRHNELRVKDKKGTLTSSERNELDRLNNLTIKAYKRDRLK